MCEPEVHPNFSECTLVLLMLVIAHLTAGQKHVLQTLNLQCTTTYTVNQRLKMSRLGYLGGMPQVTVKRVMHH